MQPIYIYSHFRQNRVISRAFFLCSSAIVDHDILIGIETTIVKSFRKILDAIPVKIACSAPAELHRETKPANDDEY